jgi:outer membrane immunogenic protein
MKGSIAAFPRLLQRRYSFIPGRVILSRSDFDTESEQENIMIKKIAAVAAFVALGSASVFAADMPMKAYAPAPAPAVYNWTGFYIGGVAGTGRTKWDRNGNYDSNPVSDSFTDSAVSVGGTVGYNWQFSPTWLFGIEGDGSWLDSRHHLTCAAGLEVSTGECYDSTSLGDLHSNWYATIRGRLGYLADPRVLLYVTGGVAFGDTTYSVHDFSGGGEGSLSQTHTGWAAGAGVEYMIAQNWTVKGEYLHIDLGSKSYLLPGTNQPEFLASIKPQYDLVRLGVNYKFGWAH